MLAKLCQAGKSTDTRNQTVAPTTARPNSGKNHHFVAIALNTSARRHYTVFYTTA
jgi:hypothetical protein